MKHPNKLGSGVQWEPIGDMPEVEPRRATHDAHPDFADLIDAPPASPRKEWGTPSAPEKMRELIDRLVERILVPGGFDALKPTSAGLTLIPESPFAYRGHRAEPTKKYPSISFGINPLVEVAVADSQRESGCLLAAMESGVTPMGCQDRIAFAYGKESGGSHGLKAFALGDGVSKTLYGGGTADVYTRMIASVLATLNESGIVLTKDIARDICAAIGRITTRENSQHKMVQDQITYDGDLGVGADFKESPEEVRERIQGMSDVAYGGTTIFAAQIQEKTGNRGRVVHCMSMGDASYAILRVDGSVERKDGKEKSTPDQLLLHTRRQDLSGMEVHQIHLEAGEMLCVFTDGLSLERVAQDLRENAPYFFSPKARDCSALSTGLLMHQIYAPNTRNWVQGSLKDFTAMDDASMVVIRG